ncbi:DMT family transporter [Marinomonas mediterranea]|uniref:DMT family transporter n=1 Tax=Marinomonas mediterranea TaxID=119864 RepID=UPI00234A773F|nr:DMT family transporter [Marinomonas mediterranea]WCN07756.1 EamA family transporter [Marinomonas mediterranea]
MRLTQYYFQTTKLPLTELMLLAVAIVWGTSYGLTKEALLYTGVFTFIALRFGITFLLLLPHVLRASWQGLNKDWVRSLPTGVILLSIFLCEVMGIALTSATNAAILISLSMIMTAFVESLTRRQWVSKPLFLTSITSVIGVALLAFNRLDATERFSLTVLFDLNSGDYLILMAAFLRAVMVTTTKYLVEGRRITSLSLTAAQSFIVSLGAIVLAAVFNGVVFAGIRIEYVSFTLPSSQDFWLITVYLIIFATLFAFFAQNYAVRKVSSTKVALLMGSEPLFGAVFASVWLNESLSAYQMIGAAMIIISVLYISLKNEKE